jgi:hypothetical protein
MPKKEFPPEKRAAVQKFYGIKIGNLSNLHQVVREQLGWGDLQIIVTPDLYIYTALWKKMLEDSRPE